MRLRGKSVLITGGAGFIGSHVAEQVALQGPRKLVVVDNFFLGENSNLDGLLDINLDYEILRMDASSITAMSEICRKYDVDTVFNLAIIPLPTSLTFPEWTIKTNIEIANTFCELARTGHIETLLHVSSSEAYGTARYIPMDENHPLDAITPYAASKSAADQIIQSYVKTFGINASIVRPFNNFGPRQNAGSYAGIIPIIINNILSDQPIIIYWDGEQTRDFTYVKHTSKALIDIFNAEPVAGEIYNLATGAETSVNQLVKMIMDVMGKSNHKIVYEPMRPGDVRKHCADITKTLNLIKYSLLPINHEQLEETIDWYLKNRND